jgi:hypothetical protein
MENLITQQWGAFGAVFLLILGPLGAFAVQQTRELRASQNARVEDAKAVAGTVISVIKDFSEAAREQVRSQTEQRAVSEHLVEALGRVEERLGSLEARLGDVISSGATTRSPIDPRRPR